MRDKQIKWKIFRIFGKTLILTVFFFLVGCNDRCEEKNDLEEIALTDNAQSGEEQADEKTDNESSGNGSKKKEESDEAVVFVYVCGAVKSPGVYELEADARVFKAIRAAGGVTEDAAPDAVNQAQIVMDGDQIYVPDAGEVQTLGLGGGETAAGSTESVKVNINTATKEELMTLTGIGEAKAESILKYREEHGRFENIEELMQIEGIKEGVFSKIEDDIII